jgi:hypothetical protein
MKFIQWIKGLIYNWKMERRYKKKIKELKKRDPYTYKNFSICILFFVRAYPKPAPSPDPKPG